MGQFVASPFKTWTKMCDKATTHASKEYHRYAMTKMEEFLVRYRNPSQGINTLKADYGGQ